MSKYVVVQGKPITDLEIPANFVKVADDWRPRNQEQARVVRYALPKEITLNQPHVTVVYGHDQRLISYNNFAVDSATPVPSTKTAIAIAQELFAKLDGDYARHLSYMRVDKLSRHFQAGAKTVVIPILWVKFAHSNGTYNWVSVGPGGQVIELERESQWDYFANRRATEEWNYDDWVLARRGQGPQLAAPEALA